jgi:hypothetical protein
MEKSKMQVEWDKIKESNLIKVKTLQKKYFNQLRVLHSDDYRHNEHVVIGWLNSESFDYVIIKSVTTSHLFKMPIWAYVLGHTMSAGDKKQLSNDEQLAAEKLVRITFDQIFI